MKRELRIGAGCFLIVVFTMLVAANVGLLGRRDGGTPAPGASMTIGLPASTAIGGTRPGKYAGSGWSCDADSRRAIAEAARNAKETLGNEEAAYVFVAHTGNHDAKVIREAVRHEFGNRVKVHGATSCEGVMTQEGLHCGVQGAVGILAIHAGTLMQFGVGSADLKSSATTEAAGAEAIRRAIADAGVPAGTIPEVVLMTGPSLSGQETELLAGIASVVGPDTPVLGGNAGFGPKRSPGTLFTNDQILSDGVVLTAIYSRLKIGWAFENGFRVTDREGLVTRAEGRTLYEIDGEPALDVYHRWTDGRLYDLIEEQGMPEAWRLTTLNPLGKEAKGREGQVHWVVSAVRPDPESFAKKSLNLAVPIEKGSRVRLLSANWQTMLHRGERVPVAAMLQGGIRNDKAAFAILFFCKRAYDVIPKSELPMLPLLTRQATGGIPFLGLITTGEQGPMAGLENVSSHLAESIVIVGQE